MASKQPDLKEAVSALGVSLALVPDNADVYNLMGVVQVETPCMLCRNQSLCIVFM